MTAKTKELGGGPATGLADSYVSALQSLINGGGMGTAGSPNAGGSTMGVMQVLQGLLNPNGQQGKAIQDIISKQGERDVNSLRSRFGAGGGTAYGTPAAFGESLLRSETAPKLTTALGQLQLSAALPLLAQFGDLSKLGIAPRQLVQQKTGFGQALGAVTGLAGAAAPFFTGGFGGGIPGAPSGDIATGGVTNPNVYGGQPLNFGQAAQNWNFFPGSNYQFGGTGMGNPSLAGYIGA